MAHNIEELLKGNREWVASINQENPEFFDRISQGQAPKFLWIGCSDSRVPASEITGAMPGSIFVQRNIANMVVHTDPNLLSVVHYAVKVLKVKHIIVCGHYGCGGVQAAMSQKKYGFLDNWLLHIKDVYRLHQVELDSIQNENMRLDRYVELNIIEQAANLAKVSFIQEEWENGEFPYIHAWVYSIKDGLIKNLDVSRNTKSNLDNLYQYKFKNTVL